MSILNTKTQLYYADYRSGSFKDISGNKTETISSGIVMNNKTCTFDGGSNHQIDLDSTFDFSSGSFLVKGVAFDSFGSGVIVSGSSTVTEFLLFVNSSGQLQCGNDAGLSNLTAYTVSVGTKYDIGCIVNGTIVRWYINGLFEEEETISSGTFHIDRIGRYNGATNTVNFFGTLDSLYVSSDVFTDTEMAQLTSELKYKPIPKKVIGRVKALPDIGNTNYNEVVNGDFVTDSDWVKGTGWAIVDGTATYDGTAGTSGIRQLLTIDQGNIYTLSFNVLSNEGTGANSVFMNSQAISAGHLEVGYHEFTFILSDTPNLYIYGRTGEVFEIDNVLVQQVGKSYLDVQFKTDFGAIANQRTISSGFIENTPFEIQSGSFKIIDDVIDGQDVKAIECISNGSFDLIGEWGGTTWELYVDTGAGYVLSDGSGIISGEVFTLTAGDKIILGNVGGGNGITKK